jgi:hypothetical protein
MNKLCFDNNIGIPNMNKLIILAKAISDEGYEINEIESTKDYNVEISFFKNDFDGIIAYENGGFVTLQLSDNEECIRLYNKIKESILP